MDANLILNVIILFSKYFIIAASFSLIFQVVKFFHFAHGIVFTSGAYFAFLYCRIMDIPLCLSIMLALLTSLFLGCLIEFCIYLPLRKKEANELILLFASLGVYIVLQNLISLTFGDELRSIRIASVQEGIKIFGVIITPIQLSIICISVSLAVLLLLFLKKTGAGTAMRAVADDPELATISGVNSDGVTLWAFAIGSALAGLAGILVALDVDMSPTMGMSALMMGVVAVIIGGIDSIPGIALAALLLATAQNLGAWFIGSQWQDAIAFIILVLFLLLKPEGFFGKKVKSANV